MKTALVLLTTALAVAPLGLAAEDAARPWLRPCRPERELFVAPDGTGDGASAATPMGLARAVAQARAGDLYWLLKGAYPAGTIELRQAGTKEKPIILRAAPGQHVKVIGKIDFLAGYNWVWGIELTDPDAGKPVGRSGSFFAGAPGVHLINNVVHDTWEAGIGGWDSGPDHVYYGNIIYKVGQHQDAKARNYPIYTQNNYDQHGHKYIVQNMFLDQRDVGGPAYNFHGYTQGGYLSGFHLRQNIMSRGRFVLGGFKEPHHHNVLEGNLFYDMPAVELGYRRPVQAEFRDNYLGRTGLATTFFWGVGDADAKPAKPRPNIYTGNTIVNPPGAAVTLRTSAYLGGQRADGKAALDPRDIFDRNVYAGKFTAHFAAGGKAADCDWATWRKLSVEGGCAFDAQSTVVPAPTAAFVAVLPNEYEPGRAHVAVFNWAKAASVTVDLSPAVAKGARFTIHPAKDAFGKPVAEGVYAAPVDLPLAGAEFAAFLVRSTAPGHRP